MQRQTDETEPLTTATTPTKPIALPPAGYEYGEPRRRYLELYGSTLVTSRYLGVALLGLSLVTLGVIGLTLRTQRTVQNMRPLVIRIDAVGRAMAVDDASLTYTPQAPELKYFLVQFVTAHYSRIRATVRQQYAESLYFLDGRLADATIEASKKASTIERFLTSGEDEIDVRVKTVALEDLRQPPYRATVEFEQVHLSPATRAEGARETHVAHLVFVVKDQVDNARIPINPLGLTITYFREDQAFVSDPGATPVIGNALLATIVVCVAALVGLMQTCTFLIPYRAVLWRAYGPTLAVWAGLCVVNVFALCYAVGRALFLKDTGQKLAHFEKQIRTGESLADELRRHLEG